MAQYDESNMGLDPEVKKYFRKIINSFSFFMLWMLVVSTAGFYFNLADIYGRWQWYNVVFYVGATLLFVLLIRFLYRTWR